MGDGADEALDHELNELDECHEYSQKVEYNFSHCITSMFCVTCKKAFRNQLERCPICNGQLRVVI